MQSTSKKSKRPPAPPIPGGQCKICTAPLKLRDEVERRLGLGESVKSIHAVVCRKFPVETKDLLPSSIYRHKDRHFAMTKRATRVMTDADRMQRRKTDAAKAVVRGDLDPAEFFSAGEIAHDIKRVENRLHGASDEAFESHQHASLASLSSTLIRSAELRAKMGGVIADKTEVNLSIAVQDVVTKLQPLLASASPDRQNAARSLLGLPASAIIPADAAMTTSAEEVDGSGHVTIEPDPVPPGKQ